MVALLLIGRHFMLRNKVSPKIFAAALVAQLRAHPYHQFTHPLLTNKDDRLDHARRP
jgi:hypothetical protein